MLLTAPTTDDKRLPAVLKYSAGFVYFVSVLGITGTKSATEEAVRAHVERIKRHTKLPVGVGFGIRTPEQAAAVARHADAAVVGTAIVDRVKAGLDANGKPKPGSRAPAYSPTSRHLQTACAASASRNFLRCDHSWNGARPSLSGHDLAPICASINAEEKACSAIDVERKERLHANFIAALDLLDAEHREPDRWEEECLSYALGAMACGMYLVAEVELAAFARPIDERSPDVRGRAGGKARAIHQGRCCATAWTTCSSATASARRR